ncbi:MAG: alpha-galactosidase [Anaerolineales bacterium]
MYELPFGVNQTLKVTASECVAQGEGHLLTGAHLSLILPFSPRRFYRHGWHSWSLTTWLDSSEPFVRPQPYIHAPQIDDPPILLEPHWQSVGLIAVETPDGGVLLLGALNLEARLRLENHHLIADAPAADARWFLAVGEETAVFAAYAAFLAKTFGARRSPSRPPRVWCSWYSLYENISEPVMLATLQGLADTPYEIFQIDDGWQQDVGDWQPNTKFPSGMAALAQAIRAAGRRPGLWLAPFIVKETAALYRQHPDWLLRDEQGQPVSAGHNWNVPVYALDTTHPEVQTWLEETIRTAHGWGYDYLKLDFLYAAALPGRRAADVPREQALRDVLTLIRRVVGEETYLLLCGVPIYPALGIADGIRIGADTAPYFDNVLVTAGMRNYITPGVQNAVRTSLNRLWLAPLVDLDPDVAFFRTRFSILQPDEMAWGQALAHICGFKATSDLPFWMGAEELAALRAFWQNWPEVSRLARWRYRVGEQEVDFSPLMPLPSWPVGD